MKQVKRFASLLLVLIMTLALAVPGLAAEEKGSITINDAFVDQTYSIYKIFDLESYNSVGAYAYKVNKEWSGFIDQSNIKGVYVKVDDLGYVTWVPSPDDDTAKATFAKLALEYAKTNDIAAVDSKKVEKDGDKINREIKFEGLELGYYLIDSSVGTLCVLNTTKPDIPVNEKNTLPNIEKKVQEDSTGIYGPKNDADIGQTVNFQTTITANAGAENYVVHDRMSAGLTFSAVTGVTLNGTTVRAYYEKDGETIINYTVVTEGLADGDTFEVRFTQNFCDTLTDKDEIIISYTATLNENAVVADAGNTNNTSLTYGDDNTKTCTPTTTYTWKVGIFKYTGPDTPLADAKFTLSKNANGIDPISLVSKGSNVYRVAKAGEDSTITEITTDSTGKFTIVGLDSGTYYLTETDAPQGYNKLADPITVVINDAGNTKVNNTTVNEVKVENKSGSELPTTGGMGTTVFYVLGGALMLGAVVLFITKKRMNLSDK